MPKSPPAMEAELAACPEGNDRRWSRSSLGMPASAAHTPSLACQAYGRQTPRFLSVPVMPEVMTNDSKSTMGTRSARAYSPSRLPSSTNPRMGPSESTSPTVMSEARSAPS
jgi:hypothetical protein